MGQGWRSGGRWGGFRGCCPDLWDLSGNLNANCCSAYTVKPNSNKWSQSTWKISRTLFPGAPEGLLKGFLVPGELWDDVRPTQQGGKHPGRRLFEPKQTYLKGVYSQQRRFRMIHQLIYPIHLDAFGAIINYFSFFNTWLLLDSCSAPDFLQLPPVLFMDWTCWKICGAISMLF